MSKTSQYNHHRRSVRLRGHDYSQPGAYFVTICAWQRECVFGEIVDGAMRLNECGRMVEEEWFGLPSRFGHVVLDESIVMPNHWHGIIVLTENVGAGSPRPPHMDVIINPEGAATAPLRNMHRPTLGQVVAFFKYQTTKRINALRGTPGAPVWQRNYYEHIIRNEVDLARIREYIVHNPLRWELDQLHPDNPSKW
jgi:putative transposase